MYPPGGGQMGPPYPHPQMHPQHMQQGGPPPGGPYMYNPAAAHVAAMANQQQQHAQVSYIPSIFDWWSVRHSFS